MYPERATDLLSALRAAAGPAREFAAELLSPTRCAGCERPGTLVCDRCLARLPLIDPTTACIRCAAPAGVLLCSECMPLEEGERCLSSLDRCLAMAVYEDPLPRIIRAYKDAGERRLHRLFAEMLYDTATHAEACDAARFLGILTAADGIAFVPATAAAYRRRGFDHMEAIARSLCEIAEKPLVDALVKHGSADQRAFGRVGRREHASGLYEVVGEVAGLHLLLIDDVITTGATMEAASATLKAAGAASVDGLALARVLSA